MSNSIDKDLLKQHFTSGRRPTQQDFHDLIDKCFNEHRTAFISGYGVTIDISDELQMKKIQRSEGKTFLVPFFERINTQIPHLLVFHYAIPLCNVGRNQVLSKIILEVEIPKSTSYEVKDNDKPIVISQQINVDHIKINNGTEEIYSSNDFIFNQGVQEIEINQSADQWLGIGVDIGVSYDIKSDRAVSDEFDLTFNNENLEHSFGSAGCIFANGKSR